MGCRCRCCFSRPAEGPVANGLRIALDMAEARRVLNPDVVDIGILVNQLVAGLPAKGLPYHMALAGKILLDRSAGMMTEHLRKSGHPI